MTMNPRFAEQMRSLDEARRKVIEQQEIETRDRFLKLWDGKLKWFVLITGLCLVSTLASCLTHVPEKTLPDYNYEHYPTMEAPHADSR